MVASLAEAWIEIACSQSFLGRSTVASLAEAWIEIAATTLSSDITIRRFPRGSVD